MRARAVSRAFLSRGSCELRGKFWSRPHQSMASMTGSGARSSAVAQLETSEQTAHRIADLVTESFAGDEVAVNLWDAGDALWRLTIHFRAAPDKDAVRALVA